MTLAVARKGDPFTDTDVIATGSENVFTNNKKTARKTADVTTGHTLPGHGFYPSVPIVTGSATVFVNNYPIARLTDAHAVHCDGHPDCHDGKISAASGNVFSG